MNTKNFLLAIAIIVTPYLATAGINQKNNFQSQQEMGGHHSKSTPADNNNSIQWDLVWPYDEYHHQRCEKTGKLHNFHFERFYRNRRKMTTFFLVKALLILVHTSSFILSVIRLLH